MRGKRNPQSTMLAFVNLNERVPPDHPLRTIKQDRRRCTLPDVRRLRQHVLAGRQSLSST